MDSWRDFFLNVKIIMYSSPTYDCLDKVLGVIEEFPCLYEDLEDLSKMWGATKNNGDQFFDVGLR